MKSSYQSRTGHPRYKVVHKSNNVQAASRRKVALGNLEISLKYYQEQEKRDAVNAKKAKAYGNDYLKGLHVLYTDKITRIEKEINTLKSRI